MYALKQAWPFEGFKPPRVSAPQNDLMELWGSPQSCVTVCFQKPSVIRSFELVPPPPPQNDLMELWSLMHFLMPHVFASHQQFKDWFCNPLTGAWALLGR